MAAIDPSVYEEIEISASNEDGKTIDLRLGVVKFNYYEDLFSPCITAQLLIVSATGVQKIPEEGVSGGEQTIETVYNGLPIRGGERIKINIKPNSASNVALKFDTPETYLYVANVSRQYADGAKEIITLDLVSREAITNETSRVVSKYAKESRISEHVKSIIDNNLASTIEDDNIDQTSNKYGFIGNLKKPFHVLVWLASKSLPDVKDSLPGYFFFQTKDGFKFKSIDKLIQDGKKIARNEKTRNYNEVRYKPSSKLSSVADFSVLQYNIIQNNDLLQKLNLGQYRSHIMQFDPLLGTFTTEEQGKFSLSDYTDDAVSLGGSPEIPKLLSNVENQNLGTLPSRLITMVTDRGILDKKPVRDKNSEPSKWQRQAYLRYQLLFTQILQMVIPLNTTLSAGDVLFIKFLQSTMEAKERDRVQSGFYMIKELCHHFDANQSLTSMTLIRDTYGEISE